ncbi:site-specific integrase [Lactococcus protaetiae]|uniref:Site-specific integrase n=1 Tax=Lactococcus protaetiae TaxID=2592653 RepID=A0A514Z722_9LACT|nr:site-specific integrase [Lactococcus protaetiae]QDK70405.1 site-specific integrase [Lactococcus protaetiae]
MATIRYRQRGVKKLWHFEIRDESGKSVAYQGGFKTKRMAQLAGSPIFQEIQNGSKLSPEMTLLNLYDYWFDVKINSKDLEVATFRKYSYYKNVIQENFDIPIKNIKTSQYQQKMNKLGEKVSYDVLQRINSVIHKSIQLAKSDKVLVDDFTLGVDLNTQKKSKLIENKYLHSISDILKLQKELRERLNYKKSVVPYVLYILLSTGMRYGEAIALTWNDINFENEIIHTYRRFNTSPKIWKFVAPKTDISIRDIPLNKNDIEVLKSLKKEQKSSNSELDIKNKNNLVFQHYGLTHDVPSTVSSNKTLRKILDDMKIEPSNLSVYGLRHTRASYLIHSGIPVDVCAKVLGHTVIQFEKTYRHLLIEKRDEGFDAIRKIL